MVLRDYQKQAIIDAREALKQNHRNICICLSVGSGKSAIAIEIIKLAKGKRVLFCSFRTILIHQLKEQFKDLDGYNIEFGTLQKIGKEKSEMFDLAIVDEAWGHSSKLKENIQAKFKITLSGTPVKDNGEVLKFDHIVQGVQLPDLVEMGYAKKIKVLSTPKVDTSNLKIQNGDFNQKQSYELMSKSEIVKDLVATYRKYCSDRMTLIFGVNIAHCEEIKTEFNNNGITAETYHSKKSEDNILQDYKDRKIEVLISVSKLNVGFDHPPVNAVFFARPCKSIPLMIQSVGRATRVNPNDKDDYCLVVDCAEVMKNCGHPMNRLDFTDKKIGYSKNQCKCGGTMVIFDKAIKDKTELSYTLYTVKRCDTCKNVVENEEFKIISILQCESCLKPIDRNIEMKITDKNICFDYKCECGFSKTVREIVLSTAELKELEYQEVMKTETWERVKKMLLVSCKRCGFKHQYANRIIEYLQDRNISIQDSIKAIEDLDSRGEKVSRLMYGYKFIGEER